MTEIAAEPDEHLEDGHGASTPGNDNLLLDYARGQAAAFAALIGTNGGRLTRLGAHGLHLCDLGVGTPFGNVAHLTRPITAGAEAEVTAAMATFFAGQPGGPYLIFSPWPTPDLRPFGLMPVGHPPLMFRPTGGTGVTVEGLEIVEVLDDDALADFERTLIEAYPVTEMQPWERGSFLNPAVLDTAWRLYVGYEDDDPVCTAGGFVTDGLSIVELVSTRPECRGKGYGAAITAAATFASPDQPAALIASDPGQGVYADLGYLRMLRYTLWLGMR